MTPDQSQTGDRSDIDRDGGSLFFSRGATPVIGIGTTLCERFTLERELGEGGMGTVYRATDQVLGRSVAIKFLKESRSGEEANRIRLEAQILARLVHDRIVRLYDFGESEGTYFLVMEEVNGPSFAHRWRDLILADRLRICAQVAEALHYAHIQGVIHRDVKPGNVLLAPGDQAKLSDFGISVVSSDREDENWPIRGTPSYMSPEQAQGHRLDHRTDLYSVGVMLYECVTGDVPFDGDAHAVIRQHASAPPPSPRLKNTEIWSTLERLILSLLAKNPGKRPASGNVVALELFEEAERAQRLWRINPGVRRSATPGLVEPPLRTVTVGQPSGEPTPAQGGDRADVGSVAQSAAASPSSDVHQMSATTGSWLSSLRDAFESLRSSRAAGDEASGHAAARQMLAETMAAPIILSPEERYLCGHYLAYLLGGARRRGILLRRPLDARNADRARLMLAMAWLSCVGPTDEAIERASELLDDRPDVRPALSPVVVMKYLASRDAPGKQQWFRQVRRRVKERSAYARKAMLDSKGVLNPGLMPRTLDDLRLIAPREGLDAHRVSLWNRVAEVWREQDEFRKAVLHYATRSNHGETASVDLWPEVVYPLIEQAHWQRTYRPPHEAVWDYVVGKLLGAPVAGVRLDRMMIIAIPLDVAEQLDLDLSTFVEEPELDEEETSSSEMPATETQASARRPFYVGGVIPREEPPADDDAPPVKVLVPLAEPEPIRFTQDTLRNLWEEAVAAQANSTRLHGPHRTIPVGPYELAVVPTGGGRSTVRAGSAVRAVLQGMQQRGKQIEIFTPSALARISGSRTVIAIWIYQDASMAIVYVDFQHKERCILWHAPQAVQFNYDYLEELRARLSVMNLEIADRIDRMVSEK
jgi:serine/threonine-protein kinase